MARSKLRFVGHNVQRVDGFDKVTGRAKFTGDLVIPGMLCGRILRSPYPHARIVSIDTSKAETHPGVVAVFTAPDGSDLDAHYSGRPIIALDRVRYVGEPVAAVAAEDEETAEEALSLISIDYEVLPGVMEVEKALSKEAPLVHEDHPQNICSHRKVQKGGDVDEGFAEAEEIFEDRFTFPMVYHYSLEPHSVIADFTDERITIWSSAQHPFLVREDIARIFHLPVAKVRLIVPYIGGGFGSKSFAKFEPLVAALARKARRPVRICLSVPESMVTVRRHAATVRLKTGVKRDGTLVAREAEIYLDTGAYDDNGPLVALRAATRVLGPYRIPHARADAYAVYTNTGSAGSFRSIGGPQTIFASECQMNIIAARLGIDPAELRFRNLLKKGKTFLPNLRPLDVDLPLGLKRLTEVFDWKRRVKKKGAAVSLACGVTNAGGQPISISLIRLQADGSITILAGSTEMGQGVRTVLSQIAAEELTHSLEAIHLENVDTTTTPYDRSTGSSRSTTLMGLAVQAAARDLKKQLIEIGADTFGVGASQVRLQGGVLVSRGSRLSFAEALQRRFGAAAGELIGRGYVSREVVDSQLPVLWEMSMGAAEIEVDWDTGKIRVLHYLSLADVGKAIHPSQCVGQEEGAAMMGFGHTLLEQMVYEEGQLLNSNLIDYGVPLFADLPDEFDTILMENEDGPGPYGSRGMGEGGILPVAPAVTSALAQVTGVFIHDLPLTPERVWRSLKESEDSDL